MRETVNCINKMCEAKETLKAEEINSYDISKLKELFPGDGSLGGKINFIQRWFQNEFVETRTTTKAKVVEEPVVEPEEEPTTTKKTYMRMSKYDCEAAGLFIANHCNGSSVDSTVKKIYAHCHEKFNKKTLRNYIRGNSHGDISLKYFKVVNDKIVSLCKPR